MLDQRDEGFSHVYFKNENLSHPWPILRHNLWSMTLHCSHMTCNPNESINHDNWPSTCHDQSCVTSYTFIIVLWVTHVTTGCTRLWGGGLHVLDSSGKQGDQLTVDSDVEIGWCDDFPITVPHAVGGSAALPGGWGWLGLRVSVTLCISLYREAPLSDPKHLDKWKVKLVAVGRGTPVQVTQELYPWALLYQE